MEWRDRKAFFVVIFLFLRGGQAAGQNAASPVLAIDRRMAVDGASLTFTCTLPSAINGSAFFLKEPDVVQGGCVSPHGNTGGTCNSGNGYTVSQDASSRTLNLFIPSVQPSLVSGIWFCRYITNGTPKDSNHLHVTDFATQTSYIAATPSAIVVGTTATLTLSCAPDRCAPESTISSIYSLQIQKIERGQRKLLAGISSLRSPSIEDVNLAQRAVATGSLSIGSSVVRGSSLQLVIKQIKCNDGGQYFCSMSGQNSQGSILKSEATVNVTAVCHGAPSCSHIPGPVVISVTPQKRYYKVNDIVYLWCRGEVGDPPGTWSWQWKTPTSSWTSFLHNVNATREPTYSSSGGCKHGATKLVHVIKTTDDGRIFRCMVNNGNILSAALELHVRDVSSSGQPAVG